jgi:hypothetical protein
MFMVKKTPTIPDPPVFQEKTPVLQGTDFRKRANPSRQWLLFSCLIIVGIIVLALVSSTALGWLKNVKISFNPAPTPVQALSFNVNRTASYAGLAYTVLNAQYATSFADDGIQTGPAIVRLNMKVTNPSTEQISVIYYDVARLIAPKLDPISPTNVTLSVGPQARTSETGWIDFSVPRGMRLDTLKLQLGSTVIGEYLVTIPFSGAFHPEIYKDRSVPQSLDINYGFPHNAPLYLTYHLSRVDIRYAYRGNQAKAGQQYYVLNFSVSNPNGDKVSPGFGYDYVRLIYNGGPPHPPVDNTLPYTFNAGAKGVNGRVVFTGPAGLGSITIDFLIQYTSAGNEYSVSL